MVLLPVTFPTFLTAPSLSETTMATLPGSGHPMSTNAEGSPRASCNPFAASCTHQHSSHCNCRQRVLAPSTACSSSLAERFFYCGSLADVALRPKELQHGCHLFPEGVPELHATVRPVSHWGTTVCTCRDLLSAPSRRATSIRAPLSRRTASLARPADLASASSARSLGQLLQCSPGLLLQGCTATCNERLCEALQSTAGTSPCMEQVSAKPTSSMCSLRALS